MIYDLTQPITDDLPVYPGDPRPSVKPITTLATDGFVISELYLGTHLGTHIDAPAHMIAGGKQFELWALPTKHFGNC